MFFPGSKDGTLNLDSSVLKNQNLELEKDELKCTNDGLELKDEMLGMKNEDLGLKNVDFGLKNEDLALKNEGLGLKNEKLGLKNADLGLNSDGFLEVKVSLLGGEGDCAWQHAQLFRLSDDDATTMPFSIRMIFDDE